jgi:hypothetical protein
VGRVSTGKVEDLEERANPSQRLATARRSRHFSSQQPSTDVSAVAMGEAQPDQLAFLMAIAAKDQGARAALVKSDGSIEIYVGRQN